ncbi:10321_t:CDS:2 [Paraglomus occultum]|uniref:Tryptophan--tRNA ligase, mitochondrial n=1 Tax=Paraglomus occultum TaxID=144539 RepID=A0A9N8VM63_9GLOM|nr:10321_t:CDS:2 [Paraglomus occultum]
MSNAKESSFTPSIFSGIQPTGMPHIGNYLGTLKQWVALQKDVSASDRILYCIVDLHALTIPQDPVKLFHNKREMALILMACGIDPQKSVIFVQSKVTAHTELSWILNCIAPVGQLSRMTQWKAKIAQYKNVQSIEDIGVSSGLCLGLLAYPILQAADVLLYKATQVPVGDDQVQHIELARDIAHKFNSQFGEIFPLPQFLFTPAKRILSLRHPTQKMSKSDPSDSARINLNDPPTLIASKIKKSTTDSIRGITYDPESRPAVSNLVTIYSAVTNLPVEQVVEEYKNSDISTFKTVVTDALIHELYPIQNTYEKLKNEKNYVEQVLEQGVHRANEIAQGTMEQVLIVIDFEATCDENPNPQALQVTKETAEIIEFAWVVVDTSTLEVVYQHSQYVKPENTTLTPFCTQLTNITWDKLENAGTLKDAIIALDNYIQSYIVSQGKNFCFCTHGAWDLRIQLPREARDKHIELPSYLAHCRMFDLKQEYQRWQVHHPDVVLKSQSLGEMCSVFDLQVVGPQHSGLNDSLTMVNIIRYFCSFGHHDVFVNPIDTNADLNQFKKEQSKVIHLAGLPHDVTQHELEAWFSGQGVRPTTLWMIRTLDQQKPSGTGFGIFATHEDAMACLEMNGRTLGDRAIEVSPSSERVIEVAGTILAPFPVGSCE